MSRPKTQTADDYAIEVSKQPSGSVNRMSEFSRLTTPNQFQILDEYPPLNPSFSQPSFSQIIRGASSQIQKPQGPSTPIKPSARTIARPVYTQKPNTEHITLTTFISMQDLPTLKRITSGFFPNDFQWYPEDLSKTQKFYEFILVDTNSVEISHSMDPANPSRIAFSKCIIKKVFKSDEWSSGPFTKKNFSKPFIPEGYSYPDYRMAWHRAFFRRSFDHSWFFTFHFDFIKTVFPIWFLQWWFDFGPIKSILPMEVISALDIYTKEATGDIFRREPMFFAEFRVPWIMCWNFTFKQHYPAPFPLSIVREFRVKWWPNFQSKMCNPQVVRNFIQTGQKPRWETSSPKSSIKFQRATTSKTLSKGKAPSLSNKELKLFKMFEQDPETASQYLEFIKMKRDSESSDHASSEGSSSEDPLGGPCAQDPYEDFIL